MSSGFRSDLHLWERPSPPKLEVIAFSAYFKSCSAFSPFSRISFPARFLSLEPDRDGH